MNITGTYTRRLLIMTCSTYVFNIYVCSVFYCLFLFYFFVILINTAVHFIPFHLHILRSFLIHPYFQQFILIQFLHSMPPNSSLMIFFIHFNTIHRHDKRVFFCRSENQRDKWVSTLQHAAHVVPIEVLWVNIPEFFLGHDFHFLF